MTCYVSAHNCWPMRYSDVSMLYTDQVTGKNDGLCSRSEVRFQSETWPFLAATLSKSALKPTQLPVQRAQGSFSLPGNIASWCTKLTTHKHLLPNARFLPTYGFRSLRAIVSDTRIAFNIPLSFECTRGSQ